ncbi:MAG: hypothetical protein VYC39_14530 [Myxococcota bacterium]|nr:hypothetical protein [Myxococcota bacterium]
MTDTCASISPNALNISKRKEQFNSATSWGLNPIQSTYKRLRHFIAQDPKSHS